MAMCFYLYFLGTVSYQQWDASRRSQEAAAQLGMRILAKRSRINLQASKCAEPIAFLGNDFKRHRQFPLSFVDSIAVCCTLYRGLPQLYLATDRTGVCPGG